MAFLSRLSWPLASGVVALAYVAIGLLSEPFMDMVSFAATVWPASGLAVFVLLVGGNRLLPGVAVGACVIGVAFGLERGASPGLVVAIGAVGGALYALQGWVGAWLVRRRVVLPSAFDDPRDILLLLLYAGPVAALVTSLPGPWLAGVAGFIVEPQPIDMFHWWLGDVTGITVALPLLLALFGRPHEHWRRRRAVVALPVIFGVVATLVAYQRVSRADDRRVIVQFAERARAMAARAHALLEVYEEGLRAVDGLFDSSEQVTSEEFDRFVVPIIARHSGIVRVAFAVSRPGEPMHAELRYASPRSASGGLVGLDVARDPSVVRALARSRDEATVIATAQIPLLTDPDRRGFLLAMPVYVDEPDPTTVAGRRAGLRGWIVATIVLDELLAAVGRGIDADAIEFIDLGSTASPPGYPELTPHTVRDTLFVDDTLMDDAPVEALGRSWILRVTASHAFSAAFREWKAWTLLAGGLLFTALLGAFLLAGSGRSARIESLVEARTAELEAANAKLRQEISRRKRGERAVASHAAELERSNAEKEILLKEIHHRVKNNLQVISSLLNLQSRQISEPEARAAFRESQSRVRSMALFHEQIYRSRDLASIDLGEYIRNVATTLIQTYAVDARAIGLRVDSDGAKAGIDLAISCGLIANELIVNSIKYAFADGKPGHIEVVVHGVDGAGELVVSDDGVGLPSGFDLHSAESFGLQLVVTLVEQLEGTIEQSSAGGPPERPGCRFVVKLPRPRVGKNTPVPLPTSITPTPLPEIG